MKLKNMIEAENKVAKEYIRTHDKTALAEQSIMINNMILFQIDKIFGEKLT